MDVSYNVVVDTLGLERDSLINQMVVYYFVLTGGGIFFYLLFTTFSYQLFFKRLANNFFPVTIDRQDTEELRRQVKHEIWIALCSIPHIAILMLPGPVFSYRGYSKMYQSVDQYGWLYFFLSIPLFFIFTDCFVYWFHRGLHHPTLYHPLHKLHHTYRYTTPFSSHAFNPVDGFGQGVPYFIFIYIFPMHHWLFSAMFVIVNFWTISIHDQVDFGGHIMNTTGHHTIHHEQFNYDYGQYFTLWDRIGGTYRPSEQTHTLSGKRLNTASMQKTK